MRQRSFANTGGGVGDAGEGGHAQAALAGNDGFGHGAHSHGVGTEFGEGTNLGGGFVAGTAEGAIDAAMEFGFGFACGGLEGFVEHGVVGLRKVDEALAALCKRTAQWVIADEIEVVGELHKFTGTEFFVDTSSGIGE